MKKVCKKYFLLWLCLMGMVSLGSCIFFPEEGVVGDECAEGVGFNASASLSYASSPCPTVNRVDAFATIGGINDGVVYIQGSFSYTEDIDILVGTTVSSDLPSWEGEREGQVVLYTIAPITEGMSIDKYTGEIMVSADIVPTGQIVYTVTATGGYVENITDNTGYSITYRGTRTTTLTIGVYKYKPHTRIALEEAIDAEIVLQGDEPDLNIIDTSQITDMSELFKDNITFNGDISRWNTSNVTTMAGMFSGATAFNQDISGWDVSTVTNMENMFTSSGLEGNEPTWWQ